jgi:60 kDa SS-A/Ro ribonucleoprotein
MANKKVFNDIHTLPKPDTTNAAGGRAYSFEKEHALCQYAATNTFNGTYYTSEAELFSKVKELVDECSSEIIASVAVYAHKESRMKDMPAYLLAVLAARGELVLFSEVFPHVITNMKMLLNFAQIVRSGATGRKSFGTAIREEIRQWIYSQNPDRLFVGSIGHSSPSFADLIKMVHPSPPDDEYDALFSYILKGKDSPKMENAPQKVKEFEAFKEDNTQKIPNVPFMKLASLSLEKSHWKDIAANMPWNTLRMNLNTLQRNGVFEDEKLTTQLANKLASREEVEKNNAFPYQLLAAYKFCSPETPTKIKNALQQAMEYATHNIPTLEGKTAVLVDMSGSMGSAVTGYRSGSTSMIRCYDVAALIGASVLRTNKEASIVGWATNAAFFDMNPFDSVMSNCKNMTDFACKHNIGCGTNLAGAINLIKEKGAVYDNVLVVSDNQSWLNEYGGYGHNGSAPAWNSYRKRNKNARIACVDLQPYANSVIPYHKSVLHIGGFSDAIWKPIEPFFNEGGSDIDWVREVKDYVGGLKLNI